MFIISKQKFKELNPKIIEEPILWMVSILRENEIPQNLYQISKQDALTKLAKDVGIINGDYTKITHEHCIYEFSEDERGITLGAFLNPSYKQKKEKRDMQLYVWDDFESAETKGLAFAIADNE